MVIKRTKLFDQQTQDQEKVVGLYTQKIIQLLVVGVGKFPTSLPTKYYHYIMVWCKVRIASSQTNTARCIL